MLGFVLLKVHDMALLDYHLKENLLGIWWSDHSKLTERETGEFPLDGTRTH